MTPNNRFERSRGRIFGEPKGGVDDQDKSASLVGNAAPRRSTSSLGVMQIAPPMGSSDRAWLALRLALWPHVSETEHLSGMADALARRHYVRLTLNTDGSPVGFVEASKRVDYVNGTSSSPVAFLEGIYVAPGFRRRGVARALVNSVVDWASAEGCLELASDSLLDNTAAHAVHCALDFKETERVVYFCRRLHDA